MLHDVPLKKLFRRKDRDEPAPLLAAVDRFDTRCRPRTRLNHRRDWIDQLGIGGNNRPGAVGDKTDQRAADRRDQDLLAHFRHGRGREAEQFAHRQQREQSLAKSHHTSNHRLGAWRHRDSVGQRDDLLYHAEFESKLLARDVEADEGFMFCRRFRRLNRDRASCHIRMGRAGAKGKRFGEKRLHVQDLGDAPTIA